jgi:hypothetical protein
MEQSDSLVGSLRGSEFDKAIAERTRATGNDIRVEHFTSSTEFSLQSLGGSSEGKISNEYFSRHC